MSRPEPLWRTALGEILRAERTDHEQRIADVAARAGIAAQYLSEIERGRKDPSSEVLSALCGALELRTSELALRVSHHLAGSGPTCLAA